MRRIMAIAAAATCLASTSLAQPVDPPPEPNLATGRLYVGGAASVQFFDDTSIGIIDLDFETGGALSGFVGYRFGNLRAEAEVSSQSADFDLSNSAFDSELDLVRATAGIYVDFVPFQVARSTRMLPYLGGGVGIAIADIGGFDDDEKGLTLHGEVGLAIAITPRIDIIPAYRYEWSDLDALDDELTAHSLRVGARYSF